MVTESISIIAVLLLSFFLTVRSGRKSVAVLILPFFIVPFFYLTAVGITKAAKGHPVTQGGFPLGMVVAGGIVGVLVSFVLSHFVPSRKGKAAFTLFGGVFSLGLMAAYLVNMI